MGVARGARGVGVGVGVNVGVGVGVRVGVAVAVAVGVAVGGSVAVAVAVAPVPGVEVVRPGKTSGPLESGVPGGILKSRYFSGFTGLPCQRISKCRCSPVEYPVLPEIPAMSTT